MAAEPLHIYTAPTGEAGLNPSATPFQMPFGFNPEAPVFMPASGIDATMRADAAEFFPQGVTLQRAAEAFQPKQKRQMPPATDEEWETRIAKREKEVATIKSLQSYRLYVEVFPPDNRGPEDPQTPDPSDRLVSKRMWKWNVEKWRLQLKGCCVYSRSVMLQCREFARQQEDASCQATQVVAEGAAAMALDMDEGGSGGVNVGLLQSMVLPPPGFSAPVKPIAAKIR